MNRQQRRWIMCCRKAIRFAQRHSLEEILQLRDGPYYRLYLGRRRGYKACNKQGTLCVKYSLAIAYHEGHLTKEGKFS